MINSKEAPRYLLIQFQVLSITDSTEIPTSGTKVPKDLKYQMSVLPFRRIKTGTPNEFTIKMTRPKLNFTQLFPMESTRRVPAPTNKI